MAKKKATRKKANRKKATRKKSAKKATRKKSSRASGAPVPELDPVALDAILVLVVAGKSRTEIVESATEDIGLAPNRVEDHVQEARRRIRVSATFDRETELGNAYNRYHLMFRMAYDGKNVDAALRAQKQLDELLSLRLLAAPTEAENPEAALDSGAAQAVVDHLAELVDASPDTPAAEIARLAALKLLEAA